MSVTAFGTNQAIRITSGFLNTQDDPAPGVSLASPSGSIVQSYAGMLGAKLHLDTKQALALSYTTTGTLYAGIYMYVKFKAGSTAANIKGGLLFWDDQANFVVTPDAAAGNIKKIAGIGLMVNTKGQYGWIQVLGKATVKFMANVTSNDLADMDLVVADVTPSNLADVLADATGLTSVNLTLAIGTALEAPADGGLKLVQLGWALALNLGVL